MHENRLLTYISLFSSAGIGCYGFKEEGFECIATNELLNKRLDIQRYNNKCRYESGYILGDIRESETKEKIFNEIKLWEKLNDIDGIDVIIATPPCQGMSVANHKKGKEEYIRNSLVIEALQVIEGINPNFFIIENVRTFLDTLCTVKDGSSIRISDAIDTYLSINYNISSTIINFKEYGCPSSRTRTLVIGVKKTIKDIAPWQLFPDKSKEMSLKDTIGNLKRLKQMGEIDEQDIYHSYKEYDIKMLPWIENLLQGQSAFDNVEKMRIPHRIIDGLIVFNKNKNGDKYRRQYWDKIAPCVHTRNDILSSQNTIHPEDNRVFSIRELMLMMSIPASFKWTNYEEKYLNTLSLEDKKKFLKKEEINIRQSIGEAVPTIIFRQIAGKIKNIQKNRSLDIRAIRKIIKINDLGNLEKLIDYINRNPSNLSFWSLSKLSELAYCKRFENAGYYTRSDICYNVIKALPEYLDKETLNILEPAVGIGSFIPHLIKKYEHISKVNIDVIDIDNDVLRIFKVLINKLNIPVNININTINADFLTVSLDKWYDLVIGNPPFKKLTNDARRLRIYKSLSYNKKTNNLASFFIERSLASGDYISLLLPKSILGSPEFDLTRELISKTQIKRIVDYAEFAFDGIKIETINISLDSNIAQFGYENNVVIESFITNSIEIKKQNYIISESYPCWLIYRNKFYDEIAEKLRFNVFTYFRDRQINKSMLSKTGEYRVLKARNIGNNKVLSIKDYDKYIGIKELESISVKKYINRKDVLLVPNLSYYPRACNLPADAIVDGSVAILIPRYTDVIIENQDISYYATNEFQMFYRIARNYGTRSLNIDKNSVFFFGIKNKN